MSQIPLDMVTCARYSRNNCITWPKFREKKTHKYYRLFSAEKREGIDRRRRRRDVTTHRSNCCNPHNTQSFQSNWIGKINQGRWKTEKILTFHFQWIFQNIKSCRSRYANDHSDDNGDKQMMKEDVKRLREKEKKYWSCGRFIDRQFLIIKGFFQDAWDDVSRFFVRISLPLWLGWDFQGFSTVFDGFLGVFRDFFKILDQLLKDSLRFLAIL